VPDAPVDKIIGKIVRNPLYGGPSTSHPHGYPWQPVPEPGFKPSFFASLAKDVKENGFRNPIILQSMAEGLYLQFGGSRLKVARKLELPTIPAIVVDWCERFSFYPRVWVGNWQTFFTDVPRIFEFTPEGVETHYALERKRRHLYDPEGFAWCGEDADFIDTDFPWVRGK